MDRAGAGVRRSGAVVVFWVVVSVFSLVDVRW